MGKSRNMLTELGGLAAKTDHSEHAILAAAEKRLAAIAPLIERSRIGVEHASEAAQNRYTDLIKERGQLQIVIAKSRAALGMV
jgi:hypothetical protein